MLVDVTMWISAVACGAILRSAMPRRDVAQAGGAFGLLVLSFQYQFGADIARPTKLVVATILALGFLAWWRFTRPASTGA